MGLHTPAQSFEDICPLCDSVWTLSFVCVLSFSPFSGVGARGPLDPVPPRPRAALVARTPSGLGLWVSALATESPARMQKYSIIKGTKCVHM